LAEGEDSGTDPSKEAAAAAEVVVPCFVCFADLSFADAGATNNVKAARIAAAIVCIEGWACGFITFLLAIRQLDIGEPFSKPYA
jgi:hypothetical protein